MLEAVLAGLTAQSVHGSRLVLSDQTDGAPAYDDPAVRGVLRALEHRGSTVEAAQHGVLPSGAWHLELPTTLRDRRVDACATVLGAPSRGGRGGRTLGRMTELDTRTVVDPELDHGDGEPKYSHYVKKDSIMLSAVEGTPSEALCGKKWVPSRDPKKYPVCPTCKEMLEMLKAMP